MGSHIYATPLKSQALDCFGRAYPDPMSDMCAMRTNPVVKAVWRNIHSLVARPIQMLAPFRRCNHDSNLSGVSTNTKQIALAAWPERTERSGVPPTVR
jgi:hypothetical protein